MKKATTSGISGISGGVVKKDGSGGGGGESNAMDLNQLMTKYLMQLQARCTLQNFFFFFSFFFCFDSFLFQLNFSCQYS